MSAVPSTTQDQQLYELVAAANPATIAEVIATMKSIDALLPDYKI